MFEQWQLQLFTNSSSLYYENASSIKILHHGSVDGYLSISLDIHSKRSNSQELKSYPHVFGDTLSFVYFDNCDERSGQERG